MAKCELQLTLDKSDRTYAPGELITGSVVVKVLERCRCRQLTLSWRWQARGWGDSDKSPDECLLTLNEGEEWIAGQELHYTFRLEAPSEPLTYHGQLVSVDWRLRAEAVVSGYQDPCPHVDVPFFLEAPEMASPVPIAIATGHPDAWHGLEVTAPSNDMGDLPLVAVLALLFVLRRFLFEQDPVLFVLLGIISVGGAVLYRRHSRETVWARSLGNLWIDPRSVAPGGSTGLRIHLRPDQELPEHELSVSMEYVELARIKRYGSGPYYYGVRTGSSTKERVVHMGTLLTCTNRALLKRELLELPLVKIALPSTAPTSFILRSSELSWRLRFEVKFKGDKRTFLQLIPFQVQPHLPMAQAQALPRYQALLVSDPSTSGPAPWLQASPPHEEKQQVHLSSEDVRRQLEGRLEVLETAHAHYRALEEALQKPKWKLHLRPRLEMLRETLRQEPALVEALERLHHRARSEGWSETEPALVLAHEVEGLRARVGALTRHHLGPSETPLERLERSVVQSLPAPLAPGEKLLCSGRFSPSLSLPGMALLLGFSVTHCATPLGIRGEAGAPGFGFWGAWMVFTALCFWFQYRGSGRFWLTESRLIWLPTRGDPLQVSLHDIRHPDGSGFRYPKGVKVVLADGHILHLQFISRARRFARQLRRAVAPLRTERSSLP
ncbi:hypothetical protein ATI61_11931 [Archangium gephyra]|uniref:Uncharacterized protein n=1 Tax=Archangium gephyra TaxID=48 RepID=A0AAC8TFB6_9BACT|nr:hypothetical protein [Archangium gephyra]AKJ03720.1 Hypothetical protein AA314_05346 [Archangium gephyra]REG22501.1 hypothetical protein ATI61_11931 [Archangium gephyra]